MRLTNISRAYIKENSQTWKDREEVRDDERREILRQERIEIAKNKKEQFVMNHQIRMKNQLITSLLEELPDREQERWKRE